MSRVANQTRSSLSLIIAFVLILLFLLPLQARAKQNAQPLSPQTQSETVNLLRSDESGVSFELFPPEFTQTAVETEKGLYDQIRIPDYGNTGITGQPDLPRKGFLIALPPGAVPVLNLVAAESHQVSGVRVAPPVQHTLLNDNYDDFTSPDYVPQFEADYPFNEEIYSQDAPYPATPAVLGQETILRHQRVVWVEVTPVQVNPVQETLTVYSRLQIEITFEFPNGRPEVETLEPESGAFAAILQDNLLNYEQSLNWRTRPEEGFTMLTETSPCMDANAFRIAVKQTGMYSISHAALSAAHPSFPAGVTSSKLRMCYEDQEIRIKVNDGGDGTFGSGDSLVFYGESIKTQETETNIYWLTYSTAGADGLRMTAASDSSAGTTPAHYIPTYHLETDGRYYSSIPRADLNDHWYWQEPIVAEPNNPNVTDQLDVTFQMSNKATGTYTFIIRTELWGFSANELHEFRVELNGTLVGTGQFNGSGTDGTFYVYEGNAPSAALLNGTNTVSIIAVDTDSNPNNSGHRFLVNWIEIEPRRQFVAQSNRLAFGQPSAGTYTFSASGFTNGATVDIYDVTDADNPTVQSKTAGGGVVSFNRNIAGASEYELSTTTGYLSPESLTKDTIGSGILGSSSNTADYIIITVPAFNSTLTPLRNLRAGQGLTVKTVYVQDIFDEFSYGRYATYAIQDFLEYVYNNWSGDRDYVLLAGDGSYDHRDVLGTNGDSNQVPVYLRSGIDSLLGETAADNQYVVFSDDSDLAQMMLGRLPAQNTGELSNMINKIIAYESSSTGSWRGRHFFVADNPYVPVSCQLDLAGDFFATVDEFVEDHFPDNQILTRLYYAPATCFPNNSGPYDTILGYYATTPEDMQDWLEAQFNTGNQIIAYTGHSGTQVWGAESYLHVSDVSALNNGNRTPIMLPMTCLEGWYHLNGTTNGLSEALVKKVGGGAVASYAPTGFQVQHGHNFLIEGFYDGIFVNNVQTLGEAVYQAKVELESGPSAYEDLHDTYMLLGDPGMQLNIPSITKNLLPVAAKP